MTETSVGRSLVDRIVEAVVSVTGPGPLLNCPPFVEQEDISAVRRQADDVSRYEYVTALEDRLRRACGVRSAVAVSSGSAALQLALKLVGVGPGDLVVVPSLSFVAAANAVAHAHAVPFFVDALETDFGIDYNYIEWVLWGAGLTPFRRIAAVVAVHMLGHPCSMNKINEIAARCNVPVIEDAAEALGSRFREHPCGSMGKVAVLSFNNNKIVTGGGGGALLTNDEGLGDRARVLATTARTDRESFVEHSSVAWNYRIPTLCAALAASQTERLDQLVAAKQALAQAYNVAFRDVEEVRFHRCADDCSSNYWLSTITVLPSCKDQVLTALASRKIYCRSMFTPMHVTPYAGYLRGPMTVTEKVFQQTICLPSGIALAKRFL